VTNKRVYWFWGILMFFTLLISESSNIYAASPDISVKLKNYVGNRSEITINITGKYNVVNDEVTKFDPGVNYTVKLQNGALQLYKDQTLIKNYGTSFQIVPAVYDLNNYVSINGRKYLGTITFTIEGGYIRPINKLPLEDYLKGVVPNEMPASWHKEALKAQATAARTYALNKIGSVIDDTILFQSYGGFYWNTSTYNNSNQAVDETTGLVLRYSGNLISAVYSSSNGGNTESNSNYWGTTQRDYLPAQVDTFDPKITWNFALEKQLINTSNLDLVNPNNWWGNVKETTGNSTAINNIKNHIKTKHFPNTDVKLVGIPNIVFSTEKTSGQKTKNGSLVVDFYVKNADGSYQRDSGANLSENYSKTLAGPSRYETSVAVANQGWTSGTEAVAVVLGRGDIPVDALTGAVLAKKYNSPLLLTTSTELPSSVLEKIKQLNPTSNKVFILGGIAAISDHVRIQLEKNGFTVVRIEGNSRYQTSVKIANEITGATEAIITSGSSNSPDALSIAAYAAKNQIPILLSESANLSYDTSKYLQTKGITKVYLIGGTSAISDAVKNEIYSLGINNVERVSGGNRYATSVEIAKRFNFDTSNVFIARGDLFVDALPGAVLASTMGAPVLLTQQNEFSYDSKNWLENLGSRPLIYYLGGESAISTITRTEVKRVLLGDLKKHTVTISGMGTLRSLIGGSTFKSYHIDGVTDKEGKLTVIGKGFGHAVGMSQYGAKARADAGHSFQQILNFYYPGAGITQ
jgi:stage II sporulation protein D